MAAAKVYISFPAQFVGMAADRSQSDWHCALAKRIRPASRRVE